ncbi:DUF58 domain-containing protein [Owenweeksia hongkongensis]|uniref:DUF58 domain-containing protein n=1 Tax=Owenweeksia hongkongensis TaxID=253245 RepID=UPI003A8D34CB
MKEETLDLQHYRDFENFEFFARQVVEGFITGLHKSPFHGFSVEFSEHRIYNPGESTKNIDWKLYGRTDRLYTKRYEEETNLRCRIIIDGSASMFYPEGGMSDVEKPNKFLFASIASLALINLLKRQRDAVGLSMFGDVEVHTEARSTYQHHKMITTEMYKALAGYKRGEHEKQSMAKTLHQVAQKVHKRSLIILFSDLFEMMEDEESIFDALQHLKYNKHELVLFWTTDKRTEVDFDFGEKPYRFVDMESGDTLKLNPSEVKQKYLKEMDAFKERLQLKCMQYQIDMVEVDVAKGYHAVLQAYLLKRKRMR